MSEGSDFLSALGYCPPKIAPLQPRGSGVTTVGPGGSLSREDLAPLPPRCSGLTVAKGGVFGAVASRNLTTGGSPSCGGGFGAIGEVSGL